MKQVLCPSLVGRQVELDRLTDLLVQPAGADNPVVVLIGEAGIGKTRLVREVAGHARDLGWRVMQGRAVQAAAPIAYRPLTEALQAGLDDTELRAVASGPDVAALSTVIPRVASDPGPVGFAQLAVLDAIKRLLSSLAGRGLLVVLEDVHWADPETLATIEYLADNLPGGRVVCLCTMRTAAGGRAEALIDGLVTRRACSRIELPRLTSAEVAEMTRLCLGDEGVRDELIGAVQSRAAGVPFLVEEMLSAYVDASGSTERTPEWVVSRHLAGAIPASYRVVVAERMERLPNVARRAVQAAAVLGHTFAWRLIGPPSELADREVLDALRAAVRVHLISATGEHYAGSFEFRHALAREAILAELLPNERADLSLRMAHEIERANPGVPGEWCERAADLLELGGDLLGAVRLLQESARRALARSAFGSAETALLRARDLCHNDWMVWMGVDDLLLSVYAAAGRTDDVAEVGERLVATYQERYPGGSREGRYGRIHLRIARGVLPSGDRPLVARHLERARALAEAGSDESLYASVLALEARLALQDGNPRTARALAIAAGERAEQQLLLDAECEALSVRADAERRSGDMAAAETSYRRLAEKAVTPQLVLWRIQALVGLARLEQARDLAVAAGAVSLLAVIDLETARAHLEVADLDQARGPLAASLEACRRHGLALLPEARAATAVLHALASDDTDLDALGHAVLALVRGNDHQALARLDETAAADPESGGWWQGLRALLALVTREDDIPTRQLQSSTQVPLPATRAYIAYCAAIQAGRDGRVGDACEAVERADGLLAPGWRRHHARRLVAEEAVRDGWGEPARWATEALEFFDHAALPRLADACRATLRRSGVPVRRRGRGDAEVPSELHTLGVTSREMDVLSLLAERLTNREIAERLFLSPRTVETHVVSLLRKAGLKSRAELAQLGRGLSQAEHPLTPGK